MSIIPELSGYMHIQSFNLMSQAASTDEATNFYHHFNSDLLIYKITRWFSHGGKTCYTGRQDTFKLYPEIGVLTALNIKKLDELFADNESIKAHFIEWHIRKLITKIEVMFTLYNHEVTAETEAYKKLHKFQLLINV